MIAVTCNKPKVHDLWELNKLIRSRWVPVNGLRVEVANDHTSTSMATCGLCFTGFHAASIPRLPGRECPEWPSP